MFHLKGGFIFGTISLLLTQPFMSELSSQDSSVGSALDGYLEGPGFKSRRLQLNLQLEKSCGIDSKQ